jgi:Lipopolysaccharide-assembly
MHRCRWLPLCVVTLALTGCAGYQLGPTNGATAGGKSVQVMPFSNQTMEPGLAEAVTAELRREVQRDGTYKLASHDDGDIILSGAIVNYVRVPLAFQPSDALTVTDYSLKLVAQVTARERSTGKVLLSQRVTGSTLVIVGSNLTSAERQARPLLANDFARNATALLADPPW